MIRHLRNILLLFFMFLLIGCGTILSLSKGETLSLSKSEAKNLNEIYLYSGFRYDWGMAHGRLGGRSAEVGKIFILDYPFSFVLDTALLPITLAISIPEFVRRSEAPNIISDMETDPEFSHHKLREYSDYKRVDILEAVARHPNLPPDVFNSLAGKEEESILINLIQNPSVTVDQLKSFLHKDSHHNEYLSDKVFYLALEKIISLNHKKTVGILIEIAFKGKNQHARSKAEGVLVKKGAKAVPDLVLALNDKNPNVKYRAMVALRKIGPKTEKIIPVFIDALGDEYSPIRGEAALALGNMGVKAEKAIPALLKFLGDRDSSVRWNAIQALRNMGIQRERPIPTEKAIPALINALSDKNESIRGNASSDLFLMGTIMGIKAEKAIPALINALKKDEYWLVRSHAAKALGNMGIKAEKAIPLLINALEDQNRFVKASAAEALGNMGSNLGPKTEKVILALTIVLKDKNYNIREAAKEAIQKIKAKKNGKK